MENEKKDWKISIGVDGYGVATNYVYGVTYEEAWASLYRQIEGDSRVLGYTVSEA